MSVVSIGRIFLLSTILLICRTQELRSVQLKDVKALTLFAGRKTNARRSAPVPQLRCTGGNAQCAARYMPKVVQCINRGSDGLEVQWDCTAELDAAVRFDIVLVTCEGFLKPSDTLVLFGSCGLEYTLELTVKGKRSHHKAKNELRQRSTSTTFNIVFFFVLFLLIFFIYRQCVASRRVGIINYNECAYDGGGSGLGFSPHVHPPPYDGSNQRPLPYNPDALPGFKSGLANDQQANDYRRLVFLNETPQPQQQHQGFSFLTGTALGGIFGYMFGRSTSHAGHAYGIGEHHSGWSNQGIHRTISESSLCSSENDSRMAHGFGGTSVR